VGLLAPFCLSWASLSKGVSSPGNSGKALVTDPRLDMITALKAMGPHPSLDGQEKVFGRLVGTWDVEYTD